MFAFNRKFLFDDEQRFCHASAEGEEACICVCEHKGAVYSDMFTLRTPWVVMSNRRVRYYSNTPFSVSEQMHTWAFEIENLMILIWERHTHTIRYIKQQHYHSELLRFWVLHTFFPLVLKLEKIYEIFHVSAVSLKGKTVLFSAFSGGGKSTLLSYFIQQGHLVYGDDTVAVEADKEGYSVIASYPFHRPYRQTETLGYPVKHFATQAQPLSHIYRLQKAAAHTEVKIVELLGIEKFEVIYQSMFVMFGYMQKERYFFATKMAQKIKVFSLSVPWNKKRLEDVYQAILMHNDV